MLLCFGDAVLQSCCVAVFLCCSVVVLLFALLVYGQVAVVQSAEKPSCSAAYCVAQLLSCVQGGAAVVLRTALNNRVDSVIESSLREIIGSKNFALINLCLNFCETTIYDYKVFLENLVAVH